MNTHIPPVPSWARPWRAFIASKLSGAQWSALRSIAENEPDRPAYRVTTITALLRWELIEPRKGVPAATALGLAVLAESNRPAA